MPPVTSPPSPVAAIPWHRRLLTRTLIFLVVPSVLPLLLVCGVAVYYVGVDARRKTEASLVAAVTAMQGNATQYLASLESDMRFVASRLSPGNSAVAGNELLVVAFAATTHHDIEAVWLQPRQGVPSVLYSQEEMLDRTRPSPLAGKRLEDTRDVAWHGTSWDPFGRPLLVASVPIRRPWELADAGWLVFSVRPVQLMELASRIPSGETGAAYFVARGGRLIAGGGRPAGATPASVQQSLALLDRRGEEDGLSSPHVLQGAGRLLAVAPVPAAGWRIVLERSESEVYRPRNRIAGLVVFAFVALIAFLLPLVITFSLRLTRPVSALLEAMERFGAGEPVVPASLPSQGELGALARGFQGMTEQRQELERRYREIVDSTDNLITHADAEGRFVFVNRVSRRAFGLEPAEAIGRRAFDFVHPDDRARTEGWLADCAAQRLTQAAIENRQVTADGARCSHWLWNCHLFYGPDGRLTGLNGIAHDVTERRLAEEEKRKVDERLAQSQRLESIGTLAGGVAHDFNNILAAIVGYGSLLKEELPPDDVLRASVDEILGAAERGAGVAQGLLAFSRKQVTRPRQVDLNDVVRKVSAFLGRIIGEDVTLTLSLSEVPLVVFADPTQLEQVLMNLAANARDAMPQGGALAVGTERVAGTVAPGSGAAGRPHALLSVTDTGSGMDEQTRARIFEPFFTTKEMGRGTGLGLAIVYGVIQQHKGEISVYSEPGRGTTFRIHLPLVAEALEEQPDATPPRPAARGTETILLAEDDRSIRALFRQVLTGHGYRVIEAEDGQAALERFAERPDEIQLILADVIMPRRSGRDLRAEVRARRPGIKVIFMSGYPSEIVRELESLEEGVEFLSKPTTPHALLVKVREVLDGIQRT